MKSTETHRVAIVGAGFAGSLTAAQILRQATGPLEVILIERRPPFGVGKAFATSLPCHLLNVPAIRMSAYPDDPEHLVRWLGSRIKGSKPASGHELFVPRSLYGEYVGETLRSAAERSRARLDGVTGEVVAIETGGDPGRVHLRMRDGSEIAASFAVLAIGNPPPSDPLAGDLEASRRYAPDPWEEGALDGLTPEGAVVTIGSNLTMVDVALALDHRNHRGPILAVSTHGLLPQHHLSRLPPAWTSRIDGNASGPRDLMRAMREETNAARTQGFEWRSVVDSLRPRTGSIWSSWPDRERRRFMRHARPYWEIHRHRMAPENADTISSLLRSGRLRVLAGRIARVRETTDALEVRIVDRGGRREERVRAARVVNCTGPGMDFRRSRDPLIRDLFARGLARPGPVGLGFDAGQDGGLIGADGVPSRALYTLGPPLKGMYWETTAVPEIRVQAQALASRFVGVALGDPPR